jgi:hypothetical protein
MLRIFFFTFLIFIQYYSFAQTSIDSIVIQEDSILINNQTGDHLIGLHFHPIVQTFDVVWLKNNLSNCALTDSVNIDTSYSNIYDLKYNALTNKVAIIGDRGNTSLLTCADVAGSVDSVKKFCYNKFDESGYVGYVNNQSQFVYRCCDGTKITVPDIDPNQIDPNKKIKIITLDSATSKKISVIISTNGYRLFDLSIQTFISDYYDTIWYFQPDVFYAKRQNQYTLLLIGAPNIGSTYNNIKLIDGHKHCLDLYNNDSTHFLFVDQLHIHPLENFNSQRGDSLMGYKYEDSILLRFKNYAGHKALYFIANLDNETFNLDTVRPIPVKDTITYPFFRNFYLVKRASSIYLSNLIDNYEDLSADYRRNYFKIDNPYNQNENYFFYVSNNNDNKSSTFFITMTVSKSFVRSLGVSIASKDAFAYVAFANNILALKDDSYSVNGKTIGGWKFIDGYKGCYSDAVQMLDGKALPDNQKYYAWQTKMRPFSSKLITNSEDCENKQSRVFAIIKDDNLKLIRVNYSIVKETTETGNSNRSKNQRSKNKNK